MEKENKNKKKNHEKKKTKKNKKTQKHISLNSFTINCNLRMCLSFS